MRVVDIVFSPTGGTRKVVDIICHATNLKRITINLMDVESHVDIQSDD